MDLLCSRDRSCFRQSGETEINRVEADPGRYLEVSRRGLGRAEGWRGQESGQAGDYGGLFAPPAGSPWRGLPPGGEDPGGGLLAVPRPRPDLGRLVLQPPHPGMTTAVFPPPLSSLPSPLTQALGTHQRTKKHEIRVFYEGNSHVLEIVKRGYF